MTFLPEDFMLSVATGAIEAVALKPRSGSHTTACHLVITEIVFIAITITLNHHCHHQHKKNSAIPGPYLSVAIIIAGTTHITLSSSPSSHRLSSSHCRRLQDPVRSHQSHLFITPGTRLGFRSLRPPEVIGQRCQRQIRTSNALVAR